MANDGPNNAHVVNTFFGAGSGQDVNKWITMGSDKPSDDPLLQLYADLRTNVYRTYFDHLTTEGMYYRQKFGDEVIPPDWREQGFKVTLPPTAYNAVQAAADHILSTPSIFVPERPQGDGDQYLREQVLAGLKSQFLEYWWEQVALDGDPVMHGKTNLIRDGKIVVKKEIDFEKLKETPVVSHFPWKFKLLSNYTVFEDPSNPYDPNFVFEAYEMRRDAAESTFPEASGNWRQGKKAWDRVRVLEYWEKPHGTSKGHRMMWIDDERVLSKINPYYWVCKVRDDGTEEYDGYVPYFIADSMWGDGDTAAPAHERYVGIIRYACSLIETEARQLTAGDAQLRIGTFPILLVQGMEEDDEQPLKVAPGVRLHIPNPETQKITVLEWPRLDPMLFNMIGRVHQYANELAKFESLGGIPQAGVDTATEAQQNFMNASSKLAGPIAALRNLMIRVNRSILADIEMILESPVTLTGLANDMPGAITLDPDDITGQWTSAVELQTSDETALNRAKLQTWASAASAFNAKGDFLDIEYAMTMAGIKNPKQRRARARQERFENDPRLYELEFAEFIQGRGPMGSMVATSIIAQLAAGGAPEETPGADPAGDEPGAGTVFPQGPAGTPSVRKPVTAGQAPAGQEIRASAFGQALDAGMGA